MSHGTLYEWHVWNKGIEISLHYQSEDDGTHKEWYMFYVLGTKKGTGRWKRNA
jgi:hypothetical protein